MQSRPISSKELNEYLGSKLEEDEPRCNFKSALIFKVSCSCAYDWRSIILTYQVCSVICLGFYNHIVSVIEAYCACSLLTSAQALDLIPSPKLTQVLCLRASEVLTSGAYELQDGASAAIIVAKLKSASFNHLLIPDSSTATLNGYKSGFDKNALR